MVPITRCRLILGAAVAPSDQQIAEFQTAVHGLSNVLTDLYPRIGASDELPVLVRRLAEALLEELSGESLTPGTNASRQRLTYGEILRARYPRPGLT